MRHLLPIVFLFFCVTFSAKLFSAESVGAQSGIVVGIYAGSVQSPGGMELKVEKMEGNRFSGTVTFFVGDSACRRVFPMSGDVAESGLIKIDVTKDVLLGCERTFVLKSVGSELHGKLKGPRGEFDVKFMRK